jgi:hypothetical protein
MVGWSSTRLVRRETPGLMASSLMLARLVDFLEATWLVKDLSGDFVRSNAARTRNGTAYRTWVLSKVGRRSDRSAGVGHAAAVKRSCTPLILH